MPNQTVQQITINGLTYPAIFETYDNCFTTTIRIWNLTFTWDCLNESLNECLGRIQNEVVRYNHNVVQRLHNTHGCMTTFIVADSFVSTVENEGQHSVYIQPVFDITEKEVKYENISFEQLVNIISRMAKVYAEVHGHVYFEFADGGSLVRDMVEKADIDTYVYGL